MKTYALLETVSLGPKVCVCVCVCLWVLQYEEN